ncbi:MAG: ectoine/hydroxyectoine ABC transporter substrate-binding protein EhuB, partial [Acidimicrobiia bacterium]|nr:ectoine/hydroxyectoine ABC transporter substrate-binding protein EhuB [Acidimicrobiia bacterium]
ADTTAAEGGADTTAAEGGAETTAAAGGGGGEVLSALQESGTVTVGIANEVPYGFEDAEGNVTGEAPEVAKVVLAELGIDNMEASVVEFGALIPGIQADRFDMIAAGMFITPERAEQIIFSDPDYCVSEAFAVAEGNPNGLTDYQSVIDSGANIAVMRGAVEDGYAVDIGVPDDQITRFDDVNAQYDAMAAGRVDAVTGTRLTVETQAEEREGMEATEGFFPVIDDVEQLGCGGFGFTDQGFRDAFNEVLHAKQEDGTVEEIVTGFGFTPEEVQAAADTTVEELLEQLGG